MAAMEIIWILFLLVLNFVAPVLIVVGLIWGFFVLRRIKREKASFDASKGDAAAMSMERQRIGARLIAVLGVILWPVAAVAAIYLGAPANAAGIAATVCSGACFLWSSAVKARYNTSFKENIVKAELSKAFGNLVYEPAGKFDAGELHALDFFEHDDVIGGNDLITAEYKGIKFSQCDLNV
jgi:hypothetical protein